MTQCILLCTLGSSWAVIPEIYGFVAPEKLDLYQNHPKASTFKDLCLKQLIQPPDEIWILTTEGTAHESLFEWWKILAEPGVLRIWQTKGIRELNTQQECEGFRELVYRACLAAREQVGLSGQLLMSLAGGRKTMSADLQQASRIFGCQALLHVVSESVIPPPLKNPSPDLLAQPLPAELARCLAPIFAGSSPRYNILDIPDDQGSLDTKHFPIPKDKPLADFEMPHQPVLWQEIDRRIADGHRLFENFLAKEDLHDNWYGLYRLEPAMLTALHQAKLSPEAEPWLRRLPKAELHAHLGGYLDLPGQVAVAQALWEQLAPKRRKSAEQKGRQLIDSWDSDWPQRLRQAGRLRPAISAYLLQQDKAWLQDQLYPADIPRLALKNTLGFWAYERPGELSGSALLSHPGAIEAYAAEIVKSARKQGLRYLELRGSPFKYASDGLDFLTRLEAALMQYTQKLPEKESLTVGFILIADRRSPPSQICQTVELAVAAREKLGGFVVGLDLAGDETQGKPEDIAPLFRPAFEACLSVTIHAGEGENAESIWKAAYLLHAERVGHGLSLASNAALAAKFRDRRICLELCPTSNLDVVGFRFPNLSLSDSLPPYPLPQLLDLDLHLTLCTDNPGISRTDLVQEYMTAAHMTQGLSWWQTLLLHRRAFQHAFLPQQARTQLIRQADQALLSLMRNSDFRHYLMKEAGHV